jgi:hypothetical protein
MPVFRVAEPVMVQADLRAWRRGMIIEMLSGDRALVVESVGGQLTKREVSTARLRTRDAHPRDRDMRYFVMNGRPPAKPSRPGDVDTRPSRNEPSGGLPGWKSNGARLLAGGSHRTDGAPSEKLSKSARRKAKRYGK